MKHHVDNVKAAILDRKKEIFLIFCLFLLAFGIRAYLMKYELFFEFDGYWHARMIQTLIETGSVPDHDPLAYYQLGGSTTRVGSDFFWWLNATIYKVVTLGGPYQESVWYLLIKILPALFGALAVVAMYFLGKEVFDRKETGYLFAFFAAVMPAFAYRTMAGWLEDDSFGFLPFVMGLTFLLRALKRDKLDQPFIINAVVAGILFGIMSFSWNGYLIVPVILTLALIIRAGWFVIGFFTQPRAKQSINQPFVAGIALTLIVFGGITLFDNDGASWVGKTIDTYATYLPISKNNLGNLGVDAGAGGGVIGQSVGEESKGLPYFFNKYNVFTLLIPLFFIILMWLLYKGAHLTEYSLILAWSIVTFAMAFSKLKFTFYFGLTMAVVVACTLWWLIQFTKKRQPFEHKTIIVLTGLLLLSGAAAGSFFVVQNVPTIEQDTGWKESLYWLRDNTPTDSKILNWWDEGHWISFIGQRAVSLDNRNFDQFSNAKVAKLLITQDLTEVESILSDFNADYIMLGSDLLLKQASLTPYAFNTTDLSDPQFYPYLSAVGGMLRCQVQQNSVSGIEQLSCNGQLQQKSEIEKLPTQWSETATPGQFLDDQRRTPAHLYRSANSTQIFFLSPTANESFIAKLWFNSTELNGKFEEVYSFKDVKIFRIKK